MPGDGLQQLYDVLKTNPNIKGLPKDYASFKTTLQNPTSAQSFYNSIKSNPTLKGIPSNYHDFSTKLGLPDTPLSDPISTTSTAPTENKEQPSIDNNGVKVPPKMGQMEQPLFNQAKDQFDKKAQSGKVVKQSDVEYNNLIKHVNENPTDVDALQQAGSKTLEKGDNLGAYQFYSQANKVQPNNPTILNQMMLAQYRAKDYAGVVNQSKEILANADKIIKSGDKDNLGRGYLLGGMALRELGNKEKSEEYFNNAIKADPSNSQFVLHFNTADNMPALKPLQDKYKDAKGNPIIQNAGDLWKLQTLKNAQILQGAQSTPEIDKDIVSGNQAIIDKYGVDALVPNLPSQELIEKQTSAEQKNRQQEISTIGDIVEGKPSGNPLVDFINPMSYVRGSMETTQKGITQIKDGFQDGHPMEVINGLFNTALGTASLTSPKFATIMQVFRGINAIPGGDIALGIASDLLPSMAGSVIDYKKHPEVKEALTNISMMLTLGVLHGLTDVGKPEGKLGDVINKSLKGEALTPEETELYKQNLNLQPTDIFTGDKEVKAKAIQDVADKIRDGEKLTPEETQLAQKYFNQIVDNSQNIKEDVKPDGEPVEKNVPKGDEDLIKPTIDQIQQLNDVHKELSKEYIRKHAELVKQGLRGEDLKNHPDLANINSQMKKIEDYFSKPKVKDFAEKEKLNTPDNVLEVQPNENAAAGEPKPGEEKKGEAKNVEGAAGEQAAAGKEVTPLQAARERVRTAKAKVDEIFKQQGIIDDPEEKARRLVEYHKSLVNFAKEGIKEGIKNVADFAKELGEDVTDAITKAWNEATAGDKVSKDKVESEREYDDPEMTKMANAINDAYIEGKFGADALDNVMAQLQDTKIRAIYDKAKAGIKDGTIDPVKVRERLLRTKTGSEQDQSTLLYDLAQLKGKEEGLQKAIIEETDPAKQSELQKQLMEVQNDMMDNALANRYIGRGASSIFRLRQVWVDKSANLSDMMEQYKAAKGVKELSPEQIKEITAQYNKLRELEAKIKAIKESEAKTKEENVRLQKENDILRQLHEQTKEERKRDRGAKATEVISRSNQRIAKAKDKLRQLRGTLSAGVNPEVAIEIGKIAAEKVYQGAVKLDVVIKNVLDEIKDIFPDFTEKDVREHIEYTRTNKPASEQSKIMQTLKKTAKVEGRTEREDFSKPEKQAREKSEALKGAEKEYAVARFQWDKARRMDMMKNRPIVEKVADTIVRFERFNVLSYPSTIAKLGAVVLHGLMLKPVKFATQALVYAATRGIETGLHELNPEKFPEKSITSQQAIWGKPQISALGKYYSEFVRNFSLENLKEHFTGIDTRETQFGKPFIYDEWSVGRGLLEMPGRTHGYIKSFIKNSEFEYAHEQLVKHYISKWGDIEKQLQDSNLTEEQRNSLLKEQKQYDPETEENDDTINKLALEHGKWSILMNDNKAVDAVRGFLNQHNILSYFAKTEFPIVKIPVNFMGRAFAVKYGFLTSFTGRSKFFAGADSKGLIGLMYKGTKGLKPQEAELLGKSLQLGTMGAGLFTLGYMNRNNIKKNSDGSWDVFGFHVSKNLVHVPEYDSLISGAETGQRQDSNKGANAFSFIENFVETDIDVIKNNPFLSTLGYGFTGKLITMLFDKSLSNRTAKQKVGDAVGGKLADMTEMGLMKETAQAIDAKEGSRSAGNLYLGEPKTRMTEGSGMDRFFQQFEKGIPGLRENLPEGELTGDEIKEIGEMKTAKADRNKILSEKIKESKKSNPDYKKLDELDKELREAIKEEGSHRRRFSILKAKQDSTKNANTGK